MKAKRQKREMGPGRSLTIRMKSAKPRRRGKFKKR